MPAPPASISEREFVDLAQLYAPAARIENARGERFRCRHWSQIDAFQWTALQPGARAWFSVAAEDLERSVAGRAVRAMVEAAETAGAPVTRTRGSVRVETVAGVTSTLGGLACDSDGRVAPGVFAAGADAGGIATGGYASGLAAALVFGRVAADSALGVR